MTGVVVGIDASNIRTGGGLLHLQKILEESGGVSDYGIDEIRLWVSPSIVGSLPSKPWLNIFPVKCFDSIPLRMLYRFFCLRKKLSLCDVAFFPGGLLLPFKGRKVSMCQNLQPFTPVDRRNASGWQRLRVEILRVLLSRSFKKADITIFVSSYSREVVEESIGSRVKYEVVPHGCDDRFFQIGKERDSENQEVLSLVYVSTINTYKNQDVAAFAVKKVRDEGLPVTITFVGGGYEPFLSKRLSLFKNLDPFGEWAFYKGQLSYEGVIEELKKSNCSLFLSTCETFGLSLVESMAAGLPMICSNIRPMSDLCGNAAFKLVNPLDVEDVAEALRQLYFERKKMAIYRDRSVERASKFTWGFAADKTFKIISGIG